MHLRQRGSGFSSSFSFISGTKFHQFSIQIREVKGYELFGEICKSKSRGCSSIESRLINSEISFLCAGGVMGMGEEIRILTKSCRLLRCAHCRGVSINIPPGTEVYWSLLKQKQHRVTKEREKNQLFQRLDQHQN